MEARIMLKNRVKIKEISVNDKFSFSPEGDVYRIIEFCKVVKDDYYRLVAIAINTKSKEEIECDLNLIRILKDNKISI